VSGKVRLGRDSVRQRNAGVVHGNKQGAAKIESHLLARGGIRLAVHVGAQDEDRLRMLLHKGMNAKISRGRLLLFGGKTGALPIRPRLPESSAEVLRILFGWPYPDLLAIRRRMGRQ